MVEWCWLTPANPQGSVKWTAAKKVDTSRWHYQENIQFCRIARGSIDEILDDLNTCVDERYGDTTQVEELKLDGYALIRRINGYIAYLRKTRQGEQE